MKPVSLKNVLSVIRDQSFAPGVRQDSFPWPAKGSRLMDWVLEDSFVRGQVEVKHSTMMRAGFYFYGKGVTEERLKKLRNLRFGKWLSSMMYQRIIYKNAFSEVARTSTGDIEKLQMIEASEMEIVANKHGTVKGYLQMPATVNDGRFVIAFKPDRIVHISGGHITSSVWADSELLTAVRLLEFKWLVENYIMWLFQSNQFRTFIKIPNHVQEDDIDEYMQMLKRGMEDPRNFLVLQGDEAEIGVLRQFEFIKELLLLLDYVNLQMMTLLQLPPIKAGIVEGSNRSSSEYQERYTFQTHIYDVLAGMAEELTIELFQEVFGWEDFNIAFGAIDDKTIKDTLQAAQQLSSLGADKPLLEKWLRERKGIDIPEGLFKDAPVGIKLDKNDTLQPSRNPSEPDMASGLNSGDTSTKSYALHRIKPQVQVMI